MNKILKTLTNKTGELLKKIKENKMNIFSIFTGLVGFIADIEDVAKKIYTLGAIISVTVFGANVALSTDKVSKVAKEDVEIVKVVHKYTDKLFDDEYVKVNGEISVTIKYSKGAVDCMLEKDKKKVFEGYLSSIADEAVEVGLTKTTYQNFGSHVDKNLHDLLMNELIEGKCYEHSKFKIIKTKSTLQKKQNWI